MIQFTETFKNVHDEAIQVWRDFVTYINQKKSIRSCIHLTQYFNDLGGNLIPCQTHED